MMYMAVSLAFIAGGILLGYLLLNVEAESGKTLNAVMFERLANNWKFLGLPIGPAIITFALLTEGRAAIRRRANRLRRWTASACDDGVGPMAAAAVLQPERAAGDAGRRDHDWDGGDAAPDRHRCES